MRSRPASQFKLRHRALIALPLLLVLAACNDERGSSSPVVEIAPPTVVPPDPDQTPAPAPSLIPEITFAADPAFVAVDASSKLAWAVLNATSCNASGDWSGEKTISGTQDVGPLSASRTYLLSCTGTGGSASKTVTITVGPPPSGGGLAMPSLQDERNTYLGWSWSWTVDKEPGAVSEPITNYAVASPEIHGDTEGDDLWTYLMMYRRSGNTVYLNRARAWAAYFKTAYRTSPEFSADDGFLLDHMYGWGLVTWYEHTCETGVCDTAALAEAENLAAVSEAHWSTRSNKAYPVPGQFRMAFYSVREGARHLLLATRVAEVTKKTRWITLRDRLIDLWLQSPDWDARGLYFFGDYETDNYLGTGSYAAGARIVSPFQIGILSEAFDQAYRTLDATDSRKALLRERLIAMARFVDQYGLDPGCQCTGYRFGIRAGKAWHSYTDGNTASCTAGFWDSAYSTSLVNVLVRGYRHSGDTDLYARARYFFNRGTKGIYGNPATRAAADNAVHHFVDTRFDSSSGNFFLSYNKGELQYTYLLFQYPHP